MKKIAFLFSTAVLVMTGCSQNEVIDEVAQNKAIEFDTYSGRPAQVRATSAVNGAIPSLGVFGYYTEGNDWTITSSPNFMKNQEVTREDDGKYVYSPLKYWPNNPNDKVSFLAYSPYKEGTELTVVDNKLTMSYEVAQTVTDQTDLLYPKNSNTINLTKQNTTEKVTFHFGHALARIGLSATYQVDDSEISATGSLDENTTITINKVVIAASDADGASPKGIFHKSGTLNLEYTEGTGFTPTWTTSDSPADNDLLSFTLTDTNFKEKVLSHNVTKIDQLNNDNAYIMIIPQDLSSKNVEVYVEYTVETTDTSLDDGKSTIINKIKNTVAGKDFAMGKAYTFRLILGMTSVKIDAVIDEDSVWSDGDKIDVDLPKNNPNTPTTTE